MRVPRNRRGTKRTQARVDHRVEVQVVADGAQMNKVGHKLVEGSIRVMNHPDLKYIVHRAIGSYNALENVFMYGGGETYNEIKEATECTRDELKKISRKGIETDFDIDGGDDVHVPIKFSSMADMAWYKAECGLFSYDYCFWCKLEKGQWGLTDISEPGKPHKLGFRRGKCWTTDDRFLHAHCLIPGGSYTCDLDGCDNEAQHTHCPSCEATITKASSEAAIADAAEPGHTNTHCKGQIHGQPPLFSMIRMEEKRVCLLHFLLRGVGIMFQWVILPLVLTEPSAQALLHFIRVDCSVYVKGISKSTKSVYKETLNKVSMQGKQCEKVLARWADICSLVFQMGELETTSDSFKRCGKIGEVWRSYYTLAASRTSSAKEREQRTRKLRALGVKFLTLWTEHGLGAHITPYIHSMLCAIPRQSLLVDLIDFSGQAVESNHPFVKSLTTNNQNVPGGSDDGGGGGGGSDGGGNESGTCPDEVTTPAPKKRRKACGSVGQVQQKAEKLAAMSQMDAGGMIRDSKTTRLHNRKLWANGRRKEFKKPEWEPVTCPLRVEDVVQLFSPANKARAKRKLGSDRISKAKQTKERCRRSRPDDSDDDGDYEDDEGCDKLSSDDKSKGKAKAKGKGKQPKGKGKGKAKAKAKQPKRRYSAASDGDSDSDYNSSDGSDYMG